MAGKLNLKNAPDKPNVGAFRRVIEAFSFDLGVISKVIEALSCDIGAIWREYGVQNIDLGANLRVNAAQDSDVGAIRRIIGAKSCLDEAKNLDFPYFLTKSANLPDACPAEDGEMGGFDCG